MAKNAERQKILAYVVDPDAEILHPDAIFESNVRVRTAEFFYS